MQSVRIIGGEWRSRRIYFPDIPGLRPTQDRIRETLFNWLMPFINGATCLDLFAGSGVLGFEALSRGVRFSCFVDSHPQALSGLRVNAVKLAMTSSQFAIIRGQAPRRVPSLPNTPFDIIFLDPPFHQNLLPATIDWLASSESLKPGGLVYLEMEKNLTLTLPAGWTIIRQQSTASLVYELVQSAPLR